MVESVDHLSYDEQARVIYGYVRYQLYGDMPDKSDVNVYSMFRAKKLDLDWLIKDVKSSINNWKTWWRPKKDWDNSQKPKHNLNETQEEPKHNLSITWDKRLEIKRLEKRKYLENVMLTDEEYEKLLEEYDKDVVDEYMNRLNGYVWQKWDKYKSHYLALLTWMRKDRVKKKAKKPDLSSDTWLWLIQIRR